MMLLIPGRDALENLDRVRDRRLVNLHRLEATLQRRVFFDRLVIFLQGRRAYALEFAAGERGLEDVRGVHRAFRAAGADHGVDFIEEQNNVPGAARFVDNLLEPLLELAAVLRSRHDPRHVERHDALAEHPLRNVARRYRLGESLDDRSLAYASLADEHRVVFGAARENLHEAADLLGSPDHGIRFAAPGKLGEVAPEGVDRRGLHGLAVAALLASVLFALAR